MRERVVDTYCDGGYCERYVERRVYRDDRRQRRYRDYDRRQQKYYYRHRSRDNDD